MDPLSAMLGLLDCSPFFQMLKSLAATGLNGNGTSASIKSDVGAFTGLNRFSGMIEEEYLSELRGLRKIQVYDKMLADPVIAGVLTASKQPIISGDWQVVPASKKPRSKDAAETVERQLGIGQKYAPQLLGCCWEMQLEKFLLALDYGWSLCVMNWEAIGNETVIKELIPIHPRTILTGTKSWEWNDQGDLVRVWQTGYKGNKYVELGIPYDRCFHYVIDGRFGNPEGRSLLRTPYKPWMLGDTDYRLLSIANQRASSGTPIIKCPPNLSEELKEEAEELARRIHVNEQGWGRITGGPVEQGGYELESFKLETDITGLLRSIEHHNVMKATSVLMQWLLGGGASDNKGQTPSPTSDPVEFSRICLDARAKSLASAINHKIVRDIVRLNHPSLDEKFYPQVRCHVSRLSAFGFADAIRKVMGTDQRAIIWGERDEEKLRTKLELPEIDAEEARKESDYIIQPNVGGANDKGSQPNNPSSGEDARVPEAKKD